MVIYADEPEQIWFNYYKSTTGNDTFIGAKVDGIDTRIKVDPLTVYNGVSYLLETGLDEEVVLPEPVVVEPEPIEPAPFIEDNTWRTVYEGAGYRVQEVIK